MTLALLADVTQNAHMDDHEFKVLCALLRDTTRHSPPPDEEAQRWVRVLDTAGGPDRWFDADVYRAVRVEECRRRGFPVSD
jgi:hypothetical protein